MNVSLISIPTIIHNKNCNIEFISNDGTYFLCSDLKLRSPSNSIVSSYHAALEVPDTAPSEAGSMSPIENQRPEAMTWALGGRMKSLPSITGVAFARRIMSFGRKYGFRRR